MTPEELSYLDWGFEQLELKEVKEALRQADCGRLVPHSTVKRLFESRYTSYPLLVLAERADVKLKWSDHCLRSTCEYFEQCGIPTERYLSEIFSTVEFICKHPGLGRPGRLRGTKEWYSAGMIGGVSRTLR
jgi:hypothetical protein